MITYSDVSYALSSPTARPRYDYPPERIRALVGDGLDPADPATLDIILSLRERDARRILSRLLKLPDVVVWAKACADRARGYASCSYADAAGAVAAAATDSAAAAARLARRYSASAAADSAADAADAADYAAHSAAHRDARAACAVEHRLACQHALALLASS